MTTTALDIADTVDHRTATRTGIAATGLAMFGLASTYLLAVVPLRKITLGTVALVTAIGGSVLVAGPAAADGETFPLDCGSAGTFVGEPNGNGEFTAAQDVNSTRVLVPVAFGEFTGTITDPNGVFVDSFTEPASIKGSGKQKSNATCTFSFTFVNDGSDPFFPIGYVLTGSGSALVKITPLSR